MAESQTLEMTPQLWIIVIVMMMYMLLVDVLLMMQMLARVHLLLYR